MTRRYLWVEPSTTDWDWDPCPVHRGYQVCWRCGGHAGGEYRLGKGWQCTKCSDEIRRSKTEGI